MPICRTNRALKASVCTARELSRTSPVAVAAVSKVATTSLTYPHRAVA